MPFGLTNAPATFQAFISDVLRDLIDIKCVVYLDDILVFSRTQEEHDEAVRQVLERLREHNLFANAKKCEFDKSSVEYLGYILSADGIKMNPKKLDTILSGRFRAPSRTSNHSSDSPIFNRRFISTLRSHCSSSSHSYAKSAPQPFALTDEARTAFEKLRSAFLSGPVLRHFKPDLPITLITDASDFALSGILHQPDEQGLLHPVAFFSRKFAPAEINYEIYDKELLAIVDSLRNFRSWTIGTAIPLAVICDHKNLEYFMSSRVLNRRQARWVHFP